MEGSTPAREVLERRKGVSDRRKGAALDPRWQGLCQAIHTTDDISFKLLALVPLVSIAAIGATLLKVETLQFTPVVALLSLFAAAVTLAIWIWERRNLQTCLWLICRAAELEENPFARPGQFFARPKPPGGKGKTEAEKLVYGLTIGAWLLLPVAVFFASQWRGSLSLATLFGAEPYVLAGAGAYALAAGLLGCLACHALLAVEIEIKADFNAKSER